MSCQDCENSIPLFIECNNEPEDTGCVSTVDAQCVVYKGDDLTCTGVTSGTRLEALLQVFDTRLCESQGQVDYSQFDLDCLRNPDNSAISTVKQFAEVVAKAICTLNDCCTSNREDIDKVGEDLGTETAAIKDPRIVSNYSTNQTLNQFLQATADQVDSINSSIDLSSVDWTNSLTVVGTPATVWEGFQAILSMIDVITSEPAPDVDNYKAKVDALDLNPGYLYDKITTDGTLSASIVTDITGQRLMELGIVQKSNAYAFDNVYFDVASSGSTDTLDSYTVTLDSSVIAALVPYTLTKTKVKAVMDTATTGTLPTGLYGYTGSSDGKIIDKIGVRNWLWDGQADGNYYVKVDSLASVSTKFTLQPLPDASVPNACALGWVDYSADIPSGTQSTTWGSYEVTNNGGTVVAGLPAIEATNYRIMEDGSELRLKGAITIDIDITNSSLMPSIASMGGRGFYITLTNIPGGGTCFDDTYAKISHSIADTALPGTGDSYAGNIRARVIFDGTTGNLYLLVVVVMPDGETTASKTLFVTFEGTTFYIS